MSARFLIIYVGLLISMAAFSTDMILPALPLIASGLDISIEQAQLLVPIYMMGFGLGQLVFGPISDQFGRRPTLIAGLIVYLLGTAGSILAHDLNWLLAARAVQGVGGGAGQTLARAMMRDRFSGSELAQNMAIATAIFAVGPMLAPVMGVWLSAAGGWRIVFYGMALFGVIMLIMACNLAETHTSLHPHSLNPLSLLGNGLAVIRHPQSRYFLLLSGFVFTAIVVFLASMPRLFLEALHSTPLEFAIIFALASSGIIIGQFANRWLIGRFDTIWAMQVGAFTLAISAGLCGVLAGIDHLTPWRMGIVMFLFNSAYLVVFSNAMSLTLDPHGTIAGFTASLAGFMGPLIGATLGSLVMQYAGASPTRWALSEAMVGILTFAALQFWRRKMQIPPAAKP